MKRVLRRIGLTVGVVLVLLLVAHTGAMLYTGHKLEQELAARRAAGLPNTFRELAQPFVPAEVNAAYHIQQAFPWAKGILQEVDDILDLPEFERNELSPESAARIAALDDAYEHMLVPLQRAAELEQYQSLVLSNLSEETGWDPLRKVLDTVGPEREVSRALHLRALQLLAEQRPEDAFGILLLNLMISRQLMREPMTVPYLVGLACKRGAAQCLPRLMALAPLSPDQRRQLDEELTRHEDSEYLRRAMQGESVYGLHKLRELAPGWAARPLMQNWQWHHLQYFREMDEAIANEGISADPPAVQTDESSILSPFVSLFAIAHEAVLVAAHDDAARIRCLRVLIALQAYLTEHPESTPTLDLLGLPPEVLRDPFTDGSLTLLKTDVGWLVYSVGRDGQDNQGDLAEEHDTGFLLPVAPAVSNAE